MKSLKLYLQLLFILVCGVAHAQPQVWKTYYAKGYLGEFADDGNNLWYVQANQLIQFNKVSGYYIYHDIPTNIFRCYSTHTQQNDNVYRIKTAHDGSVRIYTNQAIGVFANNTWSILPPVIHNYNYTAEDNVGGIWETGNFGLQYTDASGTTTTWDTTNSNLPAQPTYTTPAIDGAGNVWIAPQRYVGIFDGTQFTLFDSTDIPHLPGYDLNIQKLAISPSGDVYVNSCSIYYGISKYNGTSWEDIPFDTTMLNLEIYSIHFMAFDSAGTLYIGLWDGILKYDGNSFTLITNFPNYFVDSWGRPRNAFINPVFDANNDLWVIINNKLAKYDGTTFTLFDDSRAILNSNLLLPQVIDSDNKHYLSYWDVGGLTVRNNYTFTTYTSSSISHGLVSMALDTSETLWLGGASWGDPYTFENDTLIEHELDGCSYHGIGGIAFTSQNVGYFAGGVAGACSGLQKLENDVFSSVDVPYDVPNYSVLAVDTTDVLWIGTVPYSDVFMGEYIPAIGLIRYDGSNFTLYDSLNSGLPANTIVSLIVDSLNRIWASTENGLAIFDGSTWQVYNTANTPLPSNDIEWVHFNRGKAYIATREGFAIYDNSTWQVYTPTNSGLVNEDCESIVVDYQCNVWVATECGLSQLVGACNNTLRIVYGTLYGSGGQPMPNTLVMLMKQDAPGDNLRPVDNIYTDSNGQFAFATEEPQIYLHAMPDAIAFPGQLPVYEDSVFVQQLTYPIAVDSAAIHHNLRCKAAAGIPGTHRLRGHIEYPSGRNVSGITIFLMKNGIAVASVITTPTGTFDFENLEGGDYTIWVDQMSVNNALSPVLASMDEGNNDVYYLRLNPTYLELLMVNIAENNMPHIRVFPNPAKDKIWISIDSQAKLPAAFISIYTVAGSLVYTDKLAGGSPMAEVNLQGFENGLYIININAGESVFYQKVIISGQ